MYKTGQVLLVKFHPGQGNEMKKYRPALVVSEITQSINSRFVLIVPLSSKQAKKKQLWEVKLEESFLKKSSYALLWYVRAIDTTRVQYVLGEISPKKLKTIQRRLQRMFI